MDEGYLEISIKVFEHLPDGMVKVSDVRSEVDFPVHYLTTEQFEKLRAISPGYTMFFEKAEAYEVMT
ncbi:MAG: hypothetical protein KIT51_07790 [Cyclobacteriaceae bacterium]|nr:MAG: hypothetical protein KIT51_07790 [Cyclobacteriaceae bacterium]